MTDCVIRHSRDSEKAAIAGLHRSAFGAAEGDGIGQLVLDLFDDPGAQPCLSLVAEDAGRIVAHVLFTPVQIEGADISGGYIMAPLAVSPDYQKQGLGTALINNGVATLADDHAPFVLVYGSPDYYSRTGFRAGHGLNPPHTLSYPAEAWMVRELQPDILAGVEGTVTCANPLQAPEHW